MKHIDEAIDGAKRYWTSLVSFAETYPNIAQIVDYAHSTKQSFSTVRRKIQAINYCLAKIRISDHLNKGDLALATVVEMGQEDVLGIYQIAVNHSKEPRRNVTLGVRESQKPILQMQIERIKELLRTKDNPATTEEFADWLASHLEQLSDNEIRNHAMGVGS